MARAQYEQYDCVDSPPRHIPLPLARQATLPLRSGGSTALAHPLNQPNQEKKELFCVSDRKRRAPLGFVVEIKKAKIVEIKKRRIPLEPFGLVGSFVRN